MKKCIKYIIILFVVFLMNSCDSLMLVDTAGPDDYIYYRYPAYGYRPPIVPSPPSPTFRSIPPRNIDRPPVNHSNDRPNHRR